MTAFMVSNVTIRQVSGVDVVLVRRPPPLRTTGNCYSGASTVTQFEFRIGGVTPQKNLRGPYWYEVNQGVLSTDFPSYSSTPTPNSLYVKAAAIHAPRDAASRTETFDPANVRLNQLNNYEAPLRMWMNPCFSDSIPYADVYYLFAGTRMLGGQHPSQSNGSQRALCIPEGVQVSSGGTNFINSTFGVQPWWYQSNPELSNQSIPPVQFYVSSLEDGKQVIRAYVDPNGCAQVYAGNGYTRDRVFESVNARGPLSSYVVVETWVVEFNAPQALTGAPFDDSRIVDRLDDLNARLGTPSGTSIGADPSDRTLAFMDDLRTGNSLPSLDLSVGDSDPVFSVLGTQVLGTSVPTLDISSAAVKSAVAGVWPLIAMYIAVLGGFGIWNAIRKGD
jgi:hypothetical protein